jgi:hypothetical protein
MSMHGIERADLEGFAVKEVIIISVETYTGCELQVQRIWGLGESDFRLERPAIRADIEQLVGVVLAERSRHLKARSNDEIRLVVTKLFKRERRPPIKQHGETQLGSLGPETSRVFSCAPSLALPHAQE